MKILIDESCLSIVKAGLRKALPDVRSSHRSEALARGVGFGTNAAFRAALERGPVIVEPHDQDLWGFLATLKYEGPGLPDGDRARALRRALARVGILRVMLAEPTLTTTGFGVARQFRMTVTEYRSAFHERRSQMLDDWGADQFELAMEYLDRLEKRKTINRDYSTYGLKHEAENISRERGIRQDLGNYVSNGIFIAAAIEAGFSVKQVSWDSLNGFLNATTRSIKAFRSSMLVSIPTATAVWNAALAQN